MNADYGKSILDNNTIFRNSRRSMFDGSEIYRDTKSRGTSPVKRSLSAEKQERISEWARVYNKQELVKDLVRFLLVILGVCLVVHFYL